MQSTRVRKHKLSPCMRQSMMPAIMHTNDCFAHTLTKKNEAKKKLKLFTGQIEIYGRVNN